MGKYKHGKPDEEISLEDLKIALAKHKLSKRKEAYIILLYWIGCRRSEPLEIVKENIIEENGTLLIDIPAFKHGERGGLIRLPTSFFGVEVVKEVWLKTRSNRKLFPFCSKTGYRVVKKLFPKKSPHWLRHNRITKLRKKIDGKTISVDDVKSWTGIKSDSTIQRYGMKTQEGIDRVAKVLE